MLGPLAIRSTQPRAPHGQGSPSTSTLMWPMCPALPVGPGCSLPLRTSPPPTPVETTMHSALAWPRAAPCQCSAAVIATPSPTSTTGSSPTRARTPATSGKSRQPGMLTGLTVPDEASTGPALPMPTAATRTQSGPAASSATTSATARITVAPSLSAGVGREARATSLPRASTRAPAILVPPMSSAALRSVCIGVESPGGPGGRAYRPGVRTPVFRRLTTLSRGYARRHT